MKLFLTIWVLLFLTGCEVGTLVADLFSPAHDKSKPGHLYDNKADIQIYLEGGRYDGMVVTQLTGPMSFEIKSKARLDVLMISSCHRNFVKEKIDPNWFGGAGKRYKYNYNPSKLELDSACPLYIQAIDKSGVTAWGYISFRKPSENLPSRVQCNGRGWSFKGHTLCQSKSGFIQAISFKLPIVDFEAMENCNIKKINANEFQLRPEGWCHVTFRNGDKFHRATFLGYKNVYVRGS